MATNSEIGWHYVSLDIHNDSRQPLELCSMTEKSVEYVQQPARFLLPDAKTNATIKIKTMQSKIEGFIGYAPRGRPSDTLYSIYFANPVDGAKNYNVDVMTWDEEHTGQVHYLGAKEKDMTRAEVQLCNY